MIQMTQRQIENAFETGLKMLTSEDISTPNSWNRDLVNLQEIVVGMISGQLQITTAGAAAAAGDDGGDKTPPPDDNGEGKEDE